jgi:hypothetical protein
MSPEKSLSRYILVVLSISVVLTALVIVALNAYVTNKKLADPSNESFLNTAFSSFSYEDGYSDGYSVAREKFSLAPPNVSNISGKVTSKNDDSFQILGENLYTDEQVDGVSDKRKIVVTSDTIIKKITPLTPEEFDLAFNKSINSGTPPLPYTETEVSLMDIEEGTLVNIIANEDVTYAEVIEAIEVTFE